MSRLAVAVRSFAASQTGATIIEYALLAPVLVIFGAVCFLCALRWFRWS